MIKVVGCVAFDRWRRIWLRVLLPVVWVAEPLEEPHDRVLGRRNDLVDLRRDQTCAVEEVLGDLGPHAVRHLRVVQPLEQLLRHVVLARDQPLGRAPPHLRRGTAVLVADYRAVLGLPLAPAAVWSRAVAADDHLWKQRPALFRVIGFYRP